jgi:two-component system, LytTR family, sensor kinase
MNTGTAIRFKRSIFYHLVAWTAFIAYEVSLVVVVETASGHHSPLRFFIVPYALNIVLFYVHAQLVLKYCFDTARKKILPFLLLICLELTIYLFLLSQLQNSLETKKRFLFFSFANEVLFARTVWRGIYFMIFSTAYWAIKRSFKRIQKMKEIEKRALIEEKERQRLELELVSSQNAFLQAQINPHLLFNTLNFIHSEVQEVSETASDAIITLSDMMRYSLIENKTDGKVPLEKEVQQIENLIKINQYRFNNKLSLNFDVKGDTGTTRIVPLLLVPFVENMFKYADLSDALHPATIHFKVENSTLEFSTRNKKRKTVSFSSPGIGIDNIKFRLQSSYANRFSLQLEDRDSIFSVYLKILL